MLVRALGARDLALGAGGLIALHAGDWSAAAAQGITAAVDLIATVAARDVPRPLGCSQV